MAREFFADDVDIGPEAEGVDDSFEDGCADEMALR